MSQKQRKIKSVFTYFNDSSPDFALVSYISLLMSSNYLEYRNYFKIMQKSKFSIDEYDDDETLYIVLSLALMYKNDAMQDFFYEVLKKTKEFNIEREDFISQINRINGNITSTQSGGGEIYQYLYYIGFIIAAAFYNYYLYNNGSIQTLQNTYNRGQEILNFIEISGCTKKRPSHLASLLARGTSNSDLVLKIDSAFHCMSTPTILADQLSKYYTDQEQEILINKMKHSLKLLPGFPELTESQENGKELVLFGDNPEQHFKNKLIIYKDGSDDMDLQETKKQFRLLAAMPFEEFKKVFEYNDEQSSDPSTIPTEIPTFQSVASFVSDLAGAIGDLTPENVRVSLTLKNTFLWALQDNIKKLEWKMQDIEIDIQRKVYMFITEATRILSDISDIPSVLTLLFVLNVNAFYGIIFLCKKFFGSNQRQSHLQITNSEENKIERLEDAAVESLHNARHYEDEDDDDINDLTGRLENLSPLTTLDERKGGRRRKRKTHHKLKRKTHKRNRNKKKQTKGKKVRRFTRKY